MVIGVNHLRPDIGKPWEPKLWTPTRGDVRLRWLPDDEFDALAKKYGASQTAEGFAVWSKHWWKRNQIILRANRLDLITHEAQHIEERRNFHK